MILLDDKMFCKSILNEFTVKINVENITYNTIQLNALDYAFKSIVVSHHEFKKQEFEQ